MITDCKLHLLANENTRRDIISLARITSVIVPVENPMKEESRNYGMYCVYIENCVHRVSTQRSDFTEKSYTRLSIKWQTSLLRYLRYLKILAFNPVLCGHALLFASL